MSTRPRGLAGCLFSIPALREMNSVGVTRFIGGVDNRKTGATDDDPLGAGSSFSFDVTIQPSGIATGAGACRARAPFKPPGGGAGGRKRSGHSIS